MRKLIGTKQKMTQIFKDGHALGVTPIKFSQKANLDGLEVGMPLRVSGLSKGHGFSGVVKRWNFKGGPRTHGNKHHERAPGSIGSTDMARVMKGHKMAGRYGNERITYKGMVVVSVDEDNKLVMIHGSAPGIPGRKIEVIAPLEGESEIVTPEKESAKKEKIESPALEKEEINAEAPKAELPKEEAKEEKA